MFLFKLAFLENHLHPFFCPLVSDKSIVYNKEVFESGGAKLCAFSK